MSPPVFISYARRSSGDAARALHEALGGAQGLAFLDTSDIASGDRFPETLARAVIGARVVVCFADGPYFRRWYCLRELKLALAPYDAMLRAGVAKEIRERALEHVVVALPDGHAKQAAPDPRVGPDELSRLPPPLRGTQWPRADHTEELARLIRASFERVTRTIGESIEAAGASAAVRDILLAESAMPHPRSLAGTRLFPVELEPSLGSGFVGRADALWQLHFALARHNADGAAARAPSVALVGGGGSGKTRLALEYMHRCGPVHYPGGIFWIDADTTDDRLEEQFHGVLRTLEPSVPDLRTIRDAGDDVRRLLAEALHALPPDGDVLVVADNVPDAGRRPLGHYFPAIGKVNLIATSRARIAVAEPGTLEIQVAALEAEPAVALLTRGVDRSALNEGAWTSIAEWLGGLPLALDILAKTLLAGAISASRLLETARSRAPATQLDHAVDALRTQLPEGTIRGIAEAFELSRARLSESARHAAHVLARLSHEAIPDAFMDALPDDVAPPAVRAELRSRSFVTPAVASGVSAFGAMHRVLADYLRSTAIDETAEWATAADALLAASRTVHSRDAASWQLHGSLVPHLERCFVGAIQRGRMTVEHARLVFELGTKLDLIHHARGAYRYCAAIGETMLSFCGAVFGDEDPHTLRAMINLASTRKALGDAASARALEERALAISATVLGPEHADTLTAMNNLADTLRAIGETATARALQERVLEHRRRAHGEGHALTLQAMNNLASTLGELGALESARTMAERVLEGRLAGLGPEHHDTLVAMDNLATYLYRQRDYAHATTMQEQALGAMRRVLGEEHPTTLTTMHNLAATLEALEDHHAARSHRERLLEGRQRQLGRAHPETIMAMIALASSLEALGEVLDSRRLLERARDTARAGLGPDHPLTGQLSGILMSFEEGGD